MDTFIGTTFPTYKGGEITVVGVLPKVKGKKLRYIVECEVCSKDKDLFPEQITSCKSNLKKGATPCGCSHIPKWSKRQYLVMIHRHLKSKDFDFKGFLEWKGAKTKIKLYCKIHKTYWDTTSICNFLNGEGCRLCGREVSASKSKISTESVIEGFRGSKVFNKEDTFNRNNSRRDHKGYYSYWDFTCKVCANDIYTQQGLCSGTFTSQAYSLKKGYKPCRCSHSYPWSKEQREFQVHEVVKGYQGEFISWLGEYIGAFSKVLCKCNYGHTFHKTLNELLNNNSWCLKCAQQEPCCNGYYPERSSEKDFLYLMEFPTCNKIGRSFQPNVRKTQLTGLSSSECRIKKLYTGTHEDVYNTEQMFLRLLYEEKQLYCSGWSTETFNKKYLEVLIQKLTKELITLNLTEVTDGL